MLAALALVLGCAACTDRNPVLAEPEPELELVGMLHCTADVRTLYMTCTEATPSTPGISPALFGTNQIKLASSNVAHDAETGIFGMDVTAQNLLNYAIGTPDGTTRAGLKVFFQSGPNASYHTLGDTGTVRVHNPTGYQNFTAAQQPYFLYDTILQPQEVAAPHRWEFSVPATVKGFGFTVRVFTATQTEERVSVNAPTERPAWFADPTLEVRCYGNSPTRCLNNVVMIGFRASASQEERQSAADMVQGRVVGGDGVYYYLRVPATGTVASLESFVFRLRDLPQVELAEPYVTHASITNNHFAPYDTVGWREWKLNPDSADGDNWGLERIAAPHGWGCSIGDVTTPIAVVDEGFQAVRDLSRNVDSLNSIGWNYYSGAADTIDHGTTVAGVLAARGNDSSQVTGTMWRARLRTYDRTREPGGASPDGATPFHHVRRAGQGGARVINLSWGIAWVDSAGHPRNPELETDTAQQRRDRAGVATYRRLFEDALDAVVAGGGDPLVIVAAGNDGINAWWSGLPAAAAAGAKHANRVLVVGASRRDDSFAPWSNDSALVEVAAPGQGLTLLWGNGTVGTTRTRPSGIVAGGNGTSFSAPYVAGVAGLLFSFDPRLTAAETKRLIISGALQGNRTAGGIPILNARESLILAGQRTGAPLCGNRMWVDASNTLQVERASGDEALFSHPDLVTVTPFHGGKRIDYYTGWTYIPWYLDREGTLTFDGATWTDGPPGPATGLDLGAGQLRRGRSHGGDTSAVAMHRSLAGGATLMDLKVWASSDTVAPTVDTYPSVYHTGAATSNSPAISSDGERIATAVPYQSLGTGIYRYRIYVHERRTGTSTVLLEEDGRSMEVDSYSEDGTEIVLRYETGVGTTPDVLQYHSATTGALLRRVSTARFSGRGGYAPDRLPEGGR